MFDKYVYDEDVTKLLGFEIDEKMSYEEYYGKTLINITFTNDGKAFWLAKYKSKFYSTVIDEIVIKDDFQNLDYYLTLRKNAIETLKELKGK